MTFLEFLSERKGLPADDADMEELMSEFYEEYARLMAETKDGCSE